MDIDIDRVKQLIAERDLIEIKTARATVARFEQIDAELADLCGSAKPHTRKTQKCSNCKKAGHTARNCPDKKSAD